MVFCIIKFEFQIQSGIINNFDYSICNDVSQMNQDNWINSNISNDIRSLSSFPGFSVLDPEAFSNVFGDEEENSDITIYENSGNNQIYFHDVFDLYIVTEPYLKVIYYYYMEHY